KLAADILGVQNPVPGWAPTAVGDPARPDPPVNASPGRVEECSHFARPQPLAGVKLALDLSELVVLHWVSLLSSGWADRTGRNIRGEQPDRPELIYPYRPARA